MIERLYAQVDENGFCFCVGTPKTDYPVDSYEVVGKRLVEGEWVDVPAPPIPYEPTNTEVAQMISDLQADLIIAGVI